MSNETPRVVDKRRFTEEGLPIIHHDDLPSVEDVITGKADVPLAGVIEFSPSSEPKHVPGMDFGTALKQVIRGQRVTRLEWGNPEIWLMMFYWGAINPKTQAGKYLTIHHADGTMNPLYASDGDIMAEDWVIVV